MTVKITLVRPHPAQAHILKHRARYRVVACGRRFGKTEVGKIAVIEHALRGQKTWWLAPTYSMTAQVWRDLKHTLGHLPALTINNTEHRLDLPNGGMIAVRSTHYPDLLRGAGLDFVVLDEAAFMEGQVWDEVVRPMLLERQGAALFLSTPYGHNWFWSIFQRGQDPTQTDWASFQFSSLENPMVSPSELEVIRHSTPERIFQEEYLAQFMADAGAVFRGLEAVVGAPTPAEPLVGHRYVMGVDWGRERDYTALVVFDATTRQMVMLDRFNEIGWSLQRGRLQVAVERWRPSTIWAESNSIGSVNIEALQAEGLAVRPFATTAKSKPPLIEGLALAIERRELTLLPDPVLLHELRAYTLERMSEGGFRYSAPSGQHDDTVIATALAWYGVMQADFSMGFA